MLIPLFEARRSVERMMEHRTSYDTENKILWCNNLRVQTAIVFTMRKTWKYTPSASGCYSMQNGRQNLVVLKFDSIFSNENLGCLNRLSAVITLYQQLARFLLLLKPILLYVRVFLHFLGSHIFLYQFHYQVLAY